MHPTPETAYQYRRLTALAADLDQFSFEHGSELSDDDLFTLHELSAQMRGVAALLSGADTGRQIEVLLDVAKDRYAGMVLKLRS